MMKLSVELLDNKVKSAVINIGKMARLCLRGLSP
jgi:hypothetical protein